MDLLSILIKYRVALTNGLKVTLYLCFVIWTSGILVGCLFGAIGAAYPRTVGRVLEYLSYFVRAIPVLVLLFWFHYPFQALIEVTIHPFITAAVTLSIVNIFLMSDLVRGVLLQFPMSYVESATVCGLSPSNAFFHIKLPILLRQLIPSVLNLEIQMLQTTLFASLIAVEELFRIAQRINSIEYRPVEVYTGMALFFVMICLPLNAIATLLQSRFNRLYEIRKG